jgi:hypothetical protein
VEGHFEEIDMVSRTAFLPPPGLCPFFAGAGLMYFLVERAMSVKTSFSASPHLYQEGACAK